MWPYLVRFPGLVVMHDAGLHHARARALLTRGRMDDYRAEFAFDRPSIDPAAAEFAVNGLDRFALLPVADAPRRHDRGPGGRRTQRRAGARAVGATFQHPGVSHPHGRPGRSRGLAGPRPRPPSCRSHVRARHARKAYRRDSDRARARWSPFALTRAYARRPEVDYYRCRSSRRASVGLASSVTVTGYVDDASLRSMAAANRYRALPALADRRRNLGVVAACRSPPATPRSCPIWRTRWTCRRSIRGPGGSTTPIAAPEPGIGPDEAIAVGIDIMDEEHSLALALDAPGCRRRSAPTARPERRGVVGRHHTLAAMAADYRHALPLAADEPPRPRPATLLRRISARHARKRFSASAAEIGIDACVSCLRSERAALTSTIPNGTLDLESAVTIRLNGDAFEIEAELTVAELLDHLDIDGRRVAVEHNLVVVKRQHYASTVIGEGDEVEIVNFVGGGSHVALTSPCLTPILRHRRPHVHVAADRRHRQVPVARGHGAGARGLGRRHGHGRGAAREHRRSHERVAARLHRHDRIFLLPNTAGCYTADEAIRTARLAREAGLSELGQARGHRRRADALPRQRGAARGRRASWSRKASSSCPTPTTIRSRAGSSKTPARRR